MTGRTLTDLTDNELRLLADGCRELSCPRHGAVNAERMRRIKAGEGDE